MKYTSWTISHGIDSRHLFETKAFPLLRDCIAFANCLNSKRAYKIVKTVFYGQYSTEGTIKIIKERII